MKYKGTVVYNLGPGDPRILLTSTELVVKWMRSVFFDALDAVDREKEHMLVVLLNTQREVKHARIVGIGSLNHLLLTPREIFHPAIAHAAAEIILMHNHPSGNPTPSPDDFALNQKIKETGETIGIKLLDNVIIGKFGYVSMMDPKLVQNGKETGA